MLNKVLKIVIICTSILCFYSCSGQSSKKDISNQEHKEKAYTYASMKDGVLHLDLNEARKHPRAVKLSEICDSLIYIPLETRKECLLSGVINRVIIDGEDIFIHDGWKLFHFSIDGKFIRQIGKTGRGPGEYVCTEFCLDKKNKYVFAKANFKHRILQFDYEGNLISDSIKISSKIRNIFFSPKDNSFIGSSTYCVTQKDGNYNVLIRIKDNSEKEIFPSVYFNHNYFNSQSKRHLSYSSAEIYKYSDELYFQEITNDTVYKYTENRLEPHVILNNLQFRKPVKSSDLTYANKSKYPIHSFTMLYGESDRYMLLGLISPTYIYDKYIGELICLDQSHKKCCIVNDLDGIFDLNGIYRDLKDNIYLSKIYTAYDFIDRVDNSGNKQSKYKTYIDKIRKSITEESNHVLVLSKLKK